MDQLYSEQIDATVIEMDLKEAMQARATRAEQERDHFKMKAHEYFGMYDKAQARNEAAEQERDEAYERAAKHFEDSEHLVWSNDEAAAAIRQLASGPEK